MSFPRLRHWMSTHPGVVRTSNQDAMLCRPELGLFAVADGAGGHQDGAVAAAVTLDRLAAIPADSAPEDRMDLVRKGCHEAHRRLRAMGSAHGSDAIMATTLVVVLVHDVHFACLWAGDSRAYLLRDGILHRLTSDHSVVQFLLESGDITEVEAEAHPSGHIITRAIGAGEVVPALDKSVGMLVEKDLLLLCSDGLYKSLSLNDLSMLLGETVAEDGDAASALVEAAVAGGARDNVTAIVVEQ